MATQAMSECDAQQARFEAVRLLSRTIAAPLSDADATIQPHPDASPAKWHLAHTTWFFETFVLRDHVPGYRPFDERWAYLFNSYYEGEGARQPRHRRGMLSRPSLTEILAYRAHVDDALFAALPGLPPEAKERVELGLQHEQQHQELMLMDMLATFAENPLMPAIWAGTGPPSSRAAPMTYVPGHSGIVEIGSDGRSFTFDCEMPRHRQVLHPHALADRLVTNGEWLQFIAEGGYRRPELWLSDGWAWISSSGVEAPLYWWHLDEGWMRFGLDGLNPIQDAQPVSHVSYYEADAYARWSGARLPTEGEWESAAGGSDPDKGNQFDEPGGTGPLPAAGGPGIQQLFGDLWEWTMSAFLPYPGFRPADGTIGEYNGKFMSGQFVLRGGSWATPRGHVRASYRNFFYPHQRWQFAGVRLARDL